MFLSPLFSLSRMESVSMEPTSFNSSMGDSLFVILGAEDIDAQSVRIPVNPRVISILAFMHMK